MTSGRSRWIAVAVAVVLTVIGILMQSDGREESQSTFGTGRSGHKALFDLLIELDVPVARWFDSADKLPPKAVVWWIDETLSLFESGGGPCAGVREGGESPSDWSGVSWVSGGGTAVALLGAAARGLACNRIAGFELPERLTLDPDGNVIDREASRKRQRTRRIGTFLVDGPVASRQLRAHAMTVFDDGADWTVVASLGGHPFILERSIGDGRLVAVADGGFVRNARLAVGDAANLAVDLVRRYGTPLFDEYAHGFRPQQDVVAYLVTSPAAGILFGLFLFGLLLVWRGGVVPGLAMERDDLPAPALDSYVDSMAGWYARTADYAHVLEQYRRYAVSRLQQQLGLTPQTSLQTVVERLQASSRFEPAMIQALLDPVSPKTRGQLHAATTILDQLVREASR